MKLFRKKLLVMVMTCIMVIGCLPVNPIVAKAASDGSNSPVEMRESTPRLEELIRAVNMGFGDDVDDVSQITYAEYYRMLDKLVTLIKPDKLQQWKEQYPKARECREGLDRANAMYMIYAVAEDILGEQYCRFPQRYTFQKWSQLNGYMAAPWDEGAYNLKWDYFPDAANVVTMEGDSSNRTAKSYIFSFGQSSCNGYSLFDYDKESNSMRTADPFTWQEAMLSVIRLYESVDPYEIDTKWISIQDVGSYNKQILTDDLIDRANYMVEPTTQNLPYFTGVHIAELPTTKEDITQAKMRLLADLGFNYVRVDVSCLNFFDEEMTQADEAHLQKLDEIISWGLQYGLHVSLQFSDYPGHIQYVNHDNNTMSADSDFYTNAVKQERTKLMWQTIAKRYKGIPNQVLSFITNHEPDNPARSTGQQFDPYTEKDIERVSKEVIAAVSKVDDTRLQIYETRYDLCLDSFMKDANVIQSSFYSANDFVYWNLDTDINLTEGYVPEWPFYEVSPQLNDKKRSYTVDGFLPAGTKFDLHVKYSTQEDEQLPTVAVTADNATIYTHNCKQSDDQITFTLSDQVNNLAISIDKGTVVFDKFMVTLPEEYKSEKYYFSGTDNSITDTGKVTKKETSEINVNLGFKFKYGDYNSSKTTELRVNPDYPWVLDEEDGADLTIAENATYTSRYGYNAQTMKQRAALYAKQREQYNVQGMNMELVTSAFVSDRDTCEYLEDVLSAFKEYNIGWALFYMQDLEATRHPDTVLEPVDCGVFLDTGILSVLQKYQAERPHIKVEVPKIAHEYEEVTVDATYEKAGYHAYVCKYCGDEKDYKEYPKLQYGFYATLYKDEAKEEDTKQELGGFATVDELEKTLADKEGCLVLTLDKDMELAALPHNKGITSMIVQSNDDNDYQLRITGSELALSCDTLFRMNVLLQQPKVSVSGNGHKLTLEDMKLDGTEMTGDKLSVTCVGYVTINTALSDIDTFSLNECVNYSNTDGIVNWDKKYQKITHVFINGEVKDIAQFQVYGDNLYIGQNGSFTTNQVAGIYGNVFLQKSEQGLSCFGVNTSMKDMIWQLRMYVLDAIPENGVSENDDKPLKTINNGMIIAHVSEQTDDSCKEKLGYMSTWNNWDDYGKTLYQDERLYYADGSAVIDHLWEESYTVDRAASCGQKGSQSIHCRVCDKTKDESVIPATGAHSFGEWTIIKEPTEIEEGERRCTCLVCGEIKKETMEKKKPTEPEPVVKGSIENKDYPTTFVYGKLTKPEADNFIINSEAMPTFTWYRGDLTKEEVLPTEGDAVMGEAIPSAVGVYTLVIKTAEVEGQSHYTAAELRIKIEIVKAAPEYKVPEQLKADCGEKLSEVALPDGFFWTDDSKEILSAGASEEETEIVRKAKYIPKDTNNYKEADDISIKIKVNHVLTISHNTDDTHSKRCKNCSYETEKTLCSGGVATCTSKAICDVCQSPYGDIRKTHTFGEWTIIKEPTETEEGERRCTCLVCGEIKKETMEKKKTTEPEPDKLEQEKPQPVKVGDRLTNDKKTDRYIITDVTKKEVYYDQPVNLKTKSVVIPATVKINGVTYKVIGISDRAFKNNKTISKVTIGSNIKSIGNDVFNGCKKLKTVIIKSTKLTTKTVSKKAFKGISKKTTIKVPKKKLTAYKKLFKKKGLSSKSKLKRY